MLKVEGLLIWVEGLLSCFMVWVEGLLSLVLWVRLGVIRPLVEGLLVLVVGFKSLPLFGLDDAP